VETLGQELKRRREERNISLREVSESTHLGMRFLQAIEADDFGMLPGALYARSFIRAYARCVGMNEEEAIAKYRKQVQIEESPEPQFAPREYASEPSSRMIYVGGALLLLGVIGIGGIITTYLERRQNNTATTPSTINATNNVPINSASSPNSPTTGTSPAATNASTNSVTNPESATNNAATTNVAANNAVETAPPADPASLPTETLTLTLKTSGESWVRVYTDDAANSQTVTVKPGQTQEFKAQSKMKVTIGNLPAVQVAINGQPAKLPSVNGLVVANALISLENYRDYIAGASKVVATPKSPNNAATPAVTPRGTVSGVLPPKPPAVIKPSTVTGTGNAVTPIRPANPAVTPGNQSTRPLPAAGAAKPIGTTGNPPNLVKPLTPKPKPKPPSEPEGGEKPAPPAEKPPQPTETKPDDDDGI
jgi:cytoskeleton protein RodZ